MRICLYCEKELTKSSQKRFCSRLCSAGYHKKGKPTFFTPPTRSIDLSMELIEYLDGHLLGDGEIDCHKQVSGRYRQTFSLEHRDWAEEVQKQLSSFGVESRLSFYDYKDPRTTKTYQRVFLQTRSYREFLTLRERWYAGGKKEVPVALKLSKPGYRNWFLGDGCFSSGRIKFSTDCFSERSLEVLISLLQIEGFHPTKSGGRLFLGRNAEQKRFLKDYVGKPPSSFAYKLIDGGKGLQDNVQKRVAWDLDGTLCESRRKGQAYSTVQPIQEFCELARKLHKEGWWTIIYTARNMVTYGGNLGQIVANQVPVIQKWLKTHKIPYDELVIGKPHADYFICNKSINPLEKSPTEIYDILTKDS